MEIVGSSSLQRIKDSSLFAQKPSCNDAYPPFLNRFLNRQTFVI